MNAETGEFDRVVITTHRSVYELIVLGGGQGEVMVRGGQFFPDFQRAVVAGSFSNGGVVAPHRVCVGLHLELQVDGASFVTSAIESISPWPAQTHDA